LKNLTNASLLKAHYDIIYKNVIRRAETNQMDLNCFFDALEELGMRLFRSKDAFENLRETIDLI
jgi:hypothetical protein